MTPHTARAPLPLAIVTVVSVLSACMTTAAERREPPPHPPRPDDALSRAIPNAHTISPRFPSTDMGAATPAPSAARAAEALPFDPARITIEEPSFDEPHSLQWQRDLQRHTADVLNAAVGRLPGDPIVTTKVTFSTSQSRRDLPGLVTMHIALESTSSDGAVVRSEEVTGAFDSAAALIAAVGLETLAGTAALAAGVLNVVTFLDGLKTGDPSTSPRYLPMLGLIACALVGSVASVGISVSDALGTQEHWSDLYLSAMHAHAVDVGRALRAPQAP